jgi:hypothetical protein
MEIRKERAAAGESVASRAIWDAANGHVSDEVLMLVPHPRVRQATIHRSTALAIQFSLASGYYISARAC